MKQNLAKLVTKESVLKALQKFEASNKVLKKSTGYDLEYNGNYYPPKEVVREAATIQGIKIDDDLHSLGGGDKTNKHLKELGFNIINKTNNHLNFEKLEKYWEEYKGYFKLPKSEHKEKYKWGVLKQVYDKWDWSAKDKPKMFKEAFEVDGLKNLWISGNFYPILHTNWMFENFKNETTKQFDNLFNEKISISIRIQDFVEFYDEKLPELRKLVPDKKINYHSHKDLRAIALYLTLQYPKKYFLFKFTMFKNFSLKLDLPKIKTGDNHNLVNFIEVSNEVLEFIEEDAEFITTYKDFTSEIENYNDSDLHLLTQDFIYTVANHFNEGKKYWRVGSNDGETSYFNRMLSESYIAIGWNGIGDLELQEVDNKKGVQQLLLNEGFKFKTSNVLSRKAGEIYDFYSNASINDTVTLMDGNTVLAIGKITSDYNYDDSKPFSHFREVEWLKKEISNFIISDGPQTTFYQLSKKETLNKIESELKKISSSNTEIKMPETNKNIALNQILYGAPGTGKTYSTKKLAIEIIDDKEYFDSTEEERDIILSRYNKLALANQIHFTTFHQSMSYEDFIEGIKPETNNNRVIYDVKDGIFKKISTLAIDNIESQAVVDFNFEESFKKLKQEWEESENGEVEIKMKSSSFFYITKIKERNIEFRKASGGYGHELVNKTLKELANNRVMEGGLAIYYYPLISKLKSYHSQNKKQELKKYILIIDEINRANVSSVFGELITLLEEDKRKGNKEEIEVVLPYSQDKFSVPNNLYIIGTMNTADRSVESLDTALRRRFSFVEMPSIPEKLIYITLKGAEEINLVKMLDKINQRIELLIDKDHQIGHSFFINLKDLNGLKTAFKNKIIPLLEEYFFGDFGKIGLVLGENFISVKNENNNSGILAKFTAYEEVDFITEKKVYKINNCDELEVQDFISIYE